MQLQFSFSIDLMQTTWVQLQPSGLANLGSYLILAYLNIEFSFRWYNSPLCVPNIAELSDDGILNTVMAHWPGAGDDIVSGEQGEWSQYLCSPSPHAPGAPPLPVPAPAGAGW